MRAAPVTVPVLVTAFQEDAAALDALLQCLQADWPGVPVEVLGSDDSVLASVAGQRGTVFRAVLPPQVDDADYWCTVLDALDRQDEPLIILDGG